MRPRPGLAPQGDLLLARLRQFAVGLVAAGPIGLGQDCVRASYQAEAWRQKFGFHRWGRPSATMSARRVCRMVFTWPASVIAPTAITAIFVRLPVWLRIASANWTWNIRP